MPRWKADILDFIVVIGLLAAFVFFSFALTSLMLRISADRNYQHEGEGRMSHS